MLIAGLIGYVGGRIAPDRFKAGGGHGAAHKGYGAAVIDDHTPTPAHASFSWARFRNVLVAANRNGRRARRADRGPRLGRRAPA